MPSITTGPSIQPGQVFLSVSGRPHFMQTGGEIRGNFSQQESQIYLPSRPQPMHRGGKSRSSATLLRAVI